MTYTIKQPYADSQKQRMADWVAEMMDDSSLTAEKIGVSREAIVAQAALESGWGRAAIGHNLFGIKTDSSWKGPVLIRRTAEQDHDGNVRFENARFRGYASFADSIADHFSFLDKNAIYRRAGVFDGKGDKGSRAIVTTSVCRHTWQRR